MSLLAVEDAKARILTNAKMLGVEQVALKDAVMRTLASDLIAPRDQPPFNASAMDGYAVRATDTKDAPCTVEVIAEAPAGHNFDGTIGPGQAVRIFTGAPVPQGCDAVVMQENTNRNGSQVEIMHAVAPGHFIRPSGLDFSRDEMVLKAGSHLTARAIGLAAAMNFAIVPVRKKPRIAVLATGDELVAPGSKPRPDQIISSNSASLSAAIRRFGGEVIDLGIVPDRLDKITQAIERGCKADILVTIGGASVGDHDLVQEALKATNYELDFWRIAMRPGKPLIHARRGGQAMFGLPGNPVSALLCAFVFIRPLIQTLLGQTQNDETYYLPLAGALPANDQRQDYIRATFNRSQNGSLSVTPSSRQDSSMQKTLANADCLIIRPPHADAVKSGEFVCIQPLDL